MQSSGRFISFRSRIPLPGFFMASMEYHVPKMVGRDKELDQLKEFLHAAINGNGSTVLVSGEAGIGKTRLVKEFEAYAESLGAKVLEGRCLYESPAPFLPFREALRSVFQVSKSDAPPLQERKIKKAIKASAPDFVKAIPIVGQIIAGATVAYRTYRDEKGAEKRAEWGALFERDEGLEAISSLLVAISAKQPLLIFIDDLHSADTPSLSLLYYLARDVRNSKILVVGAYRPEEVSKTYEGTVHPLLDIMQRMSRDDLFRKIELKRLSQINYFDFIRSMLSVELGDLIRLIYEETDGNPFFAIETLRLLMQQNVLTKEDDHWKLSKSIEEVQIPPRVYDVVVSRINALRDEERDILDCASVVGEEFSSGVVENVSGLNRIGLLKCLNNVERRYHLVHSFEGGYRFDHSKIREVLYNEIAPELRKEYHSMIAKYMEEANKDSLEQVVSELAYHYYQSGNAQKGIPYLLKAGKDAEEKWAAFEAVRFYSQALEMMGDDERWRHERTKTLEALGDVYAFTGQHEKANECYEKGMGIAEDDMARDRMRRKIRKKMILKKNGLKLAYYVYGEGEPTLVFVVAWIGSAELWIPQVDYFSQNFKMVTIDMRGAGESDKPADDYTIDLYVDDLNSIIEELQEKNIVLIGESMGAQIAIKYVATYPGKVSKLVLTGGTPKIIASDDFPDGFPLEVSQRLLILFQESYSRGLRTFIKFVFPEAGTEYLRESAFAVCQKTTKEIAINCFSNFLKEDLRPLLGKIDIPTLIIHGENDRLMLLEAAKYMHENISGSKMYVFKDKGHAPSITAADKFNKILEEFIKTGKPMKDYRSSERTKSPDL
jgi:pimeloyl-ACP methyl ester carboxylesterase